LDIEERGEDIDDWIVDDDGYADLEEGKGRGGVVVATKAQAAFGPGSTGMKNKKRYLGESSFLIFHSSPRDDVWDSDEGRQNDD
jgi:hypothetical protein